MVVAVAGGAAGRVVNEKTDCAGAAAPEVTCATPLPVGAGVDELSGFPRPNADDGVSGTPPAAANDAVRSGRDRFAPRRNQSLF